MLTLFVSATNQCVFHLGHSSYLLFASLHFASSKKQQRSKAKLRICQTRIDVGERLGWISLLGVLPHAEKSNNNPYEHKSNENQSIWWEDMDRHSMHSRQLSHTCWHIYCTWYEGCRKCWNLMWEPEFYTCVPLPQLYFISLLLYY